jgi:hypothetical protein
MDHQVDLDVNFLNGLRSRRLPLMLPALSRSALMSHLLDYKYNLLPRSATDPNPWWTIKAVRGRFSVEP